MNDDVNDVGIVPSGSLNPSCWAGWRSTLESSPGQIVFGADGLMRFKFLLSGQVHVMASKIVPQKKLFWAVP